MSHIKDAHSTNSSKGFGKDPSLTNKIEQAEKENLELIKKIQQAKKERAFYEAEYNKIVRSREWHKTKPIRDFINKVTFKRAQ